MRLPSVPTAARRAVQHVVGSRLVLWDAGPIKIAFAMRGMLRADQQCLKSSSVEWAWRTVGAVPRGIFGSPNSHVSGPGLFRASGVEESPNAAR